MPKNKTSLRNIPQHPLPARLVSVASGWVLPEAERIPDILTFLLALLSYTHSWSSLNITAMPLYGHPVTPALTRLFLPPSSRPGPMKTTHCCHLCLGPLTVTSRGFLCPMLTSVTVPVMNSPGSPYAPLAASWCLQQGGILG